MPSNWGESTGIPVYSLEEAITLLPGSSPVIYLGWLHASHVKGYPRPLKSFCRDATDIREKATIRNGGENS